jgi:hypothetical protein
MNKGNWRINDEFEDRIRFYYDLTPSLVPMSKWIDRTESIEKN